MKILLLGEASFVHSTLRKGFRALGHEVKLVSSGNVWNCPRDIDVSRDMTRGKLGGLKVVWKLLWNIRSLVGNDIVQMNDFHTIPLKLGWNELFFKFIKRFNKKVVRGCWGDDIVVFDAQVQGVLAYSDTHIG
ncbi:MAG: glycosyltransferase family 1 protein, partial [Prevotellaceae bacterium]|nr:glycosyltransferase family 1 protein [Prevotellaceae bacterium]